MRIYSTQESIKAREISVLAVVETLGAMSLAVSIAVYFGTLKHIAISACVAPLLLLRTEKSTVLGVRIFDGMRKRLDAIEGWIRKLEDSRLSLWKHFSVLIGRLSWLFLTFTLLPCFGPLARVFATVIVVLRHPIAAFRTVPDNWQRMTCCVDTCHAPEVVPKYGARGDDPGLTVLGSFRVCLIAGGSGAFP